MRFLRRATKPARLYSRHPCPLCDRLVHDLERARLRPRLDLEIVDVDADPELAARFGESVPVLEVEGTILVVDCDVVFAHEGNNQWEPTSLESLLERYKVSQ